MKLKAQTEILKDKTTHYKTKYQEIEQELITKIRELTHKRKERKNNLSQKQKQTLKIYRKMKT